MFWLNHKFITMLTLELPLWLNLFLDFKQLSYISKLTEVFTKSSLQQDAWTIYLLRMIFIMLIKKVTNIFLKFEKSLLKQNVIGLSVVHN